MNPISPTPSAPLRLRRAWIAAALLLPLASSCFLAVVGAGAGAGYVIRRETTEDGSIEAEVKEDVDDVWKAVRESLDILHDLKSDVVLQDFPREAYTQIDGREVWVRVDAYDLERTILTVRAREPLGPDERMARRVLEDVTDRL